jgi:NADH-ubiquinone oxidoreductase chain 2
MAILLKNNMPYNRISTLILFYAGALTLNALYIQSIGSGIGIYGGLFQITLISQFFDLFIYLIGAMILIAWPSLYYSYIEFDDKSRINYMTEYSLIILFSMFGASLLISSSDFISTYLSIELQSFGVYVIASLYKNSENATSAGLKYFLLGGLSSCMILLGIGLIYSYTGLTKLESLYSLISVSYNDNDIVRSSMLGLSLMIIGFLFKIAAAPLHNWAPDVYNDSPTIVTIWLTIMPKISILFFLLELYTHINIESLWTNETFDILKYLLLISSSLSLLLGTIVGLSQIRIKRLLAYSTISHIGFILLALAISTEQSIESMIFYIIQYTITNLNSFLIIIALSYVFHDVILFNFVETYKEKNKNKNKSEKNKNKKFVEFSDIEYITELKSKYSYNNLLSLGLSISLFSMAGIPPLIGFFSKQFVLSSAIQNGYYFMAIIAIVVSVISASYYLKIIRVLHTDTVGSNIFERMNYKSNFDSSLSDIHSFFISILTLMILFFVIKPSIILSSIRILSLSMYYY